MLTVKNLSFGYGGNDFLKNINLNITPGEIVSVVGSNGCGKSTLLKCICGLNPTAKSVTLNGRYIEEYSLRQKAKLISYLPQIVEKLTAISV